MVRHLLELIWAFDDDEGMSEVGYLATCGLIETVFGEKVRAEFGRIIKATDGRFYFNKKRAAEDFIRFALDNI